MSIYAEWVEKDGRFAFSHDESKGVKISREERRSLLAEESLGKILKPDGNGYPVAVAAGPVTDVQLAEIERAWRDNELSSIKWLCERHRDQLEVGAETTLTADQFKELLVYLQALRDWPQSSDFPDVQHRPSAPPWIAEQVE